MQFILLILLVAIVYVLFVRTRRVDLLTIYGAALILYSLPTIFGIVYDPFSRTFVTVGPATTMVTIVAFSGLLVVLLLTEGKSVSVSFGSVQRETSPAFLYIGVIATFVLMLASRDAIVTAGTKRELLETVDFGHMILSSIVPVFFLYAVISGRKHFAIFFSIAVLLLLVTGTRRPAAIAGTGLIFVWLSQFEISILRRWKASLAVLSLGFVIVVGKSFYAFILAYGLRGAGIWVSSVNYDLVVGGAEFMSNSCILDAVANSQFSVPYTHVPKALLSALPVPVSYFGVSSSAFNDLFQHSLFRSVTYGMSYNPWAEAYSWAGYVGVAIYAVIIPFSTQQVQRLAVKVGQEPLGSILLTMGITLAFWVHRNSLATEIAYIRNIFYPAFGLLVASNLLSRRRLYAFSNN